MPGANDFSDGHIFVDFASTANAVQELDMQTNQINNWLQQLDQELQVLKESWIGDDREVYDEKQTSWNRAVDRMREILKNNAHVLEDVREAYNQNQKNSALRWQETRGGGGY
ncbi:WXG100 family type VII secretion target [Streptomyces sp. NPDC001928]|uniref:WXG100 family type VII secretion target n=1 Tax=Streptomyces sp. NPDC001928 TaxID=3154404 RepID=UPI0033255A8F